MICARSRLKSPTHIVTMRILFGHPWMHSCPDITCKSGHNGCDTYLIFHHYTYSVTCPCSIDLGKCLSHSLLQSNFVRRPQPQWIAPSSNRCPACTCATQTCGPCLSLQERCLAAAAPQPLESSFEGTPVTPCQAWPVNAHTHTAAFKSAHLPL